MSKYLFKASLTAGGVEGLRSQGGSARRDLVQKAIGELGGTVEAFYFAFGDEDVYVVADMPDNEKAAAFALQVSASGTVSVSTTVLLTAEEVDRAGKQQTSWAPPGG